MAGHPGSGKSLVAKGLAGATGAVLIDRDIIKSTMLEMGIDDETAAPVAYETFLRVADSIARQGFSVILDSTAYYPVIRDKGRETADVTGAPYFIVDVVCSDRTELERRLKERDSMPSQIDGFEGDPLDQPGAEPIDEPHLQVDTCVHSIEDCVRQAQEYMLR
jgi:predicted kinase